jgi:hypothetical protein
MKNTELDHRTRSLEQNLLMHMMHAMLVHMIYFIYQRNFRVLFANIGNINHLDIYGNIISIISGKYFYTKEVQSW